MSSNYPPLYTIELERDGKRYELRKQNGHYLLIQNDGTETTHDSIGSVRLAIGSVGEDTRMTVRRADGTTIWETSL